MNPTVALALIGKRWRDWQKVAPYQHPIQQKTERENLLQLYRLYKKMIKKIKEAKRQQIFSKNLVIQGNGTIKFCMQPVNFTNYYDYVGMDLDTYMELFHLVKSKIKKHHFYVNPIPAHKRLQICLRYLASGDSMPMISYSFGVASNTVSKIITEICQVLWDTLKDTVLPLPTTEMWKEKAQDFQIKYNFPNCIGAIDAKQFVFKTEFRKKPKDYQNKECLVVFAITDANLCFCCVKVGIENSIENRIEFSRSKIGNILQNNLLNLPPPTKITENGPELPFVFIGDEDFTLTSHILRPYNLTDNSGIAEEIFNDKLINTKNHTDRAFKILTNRWKVYQKKCANSIPNAKKILKAIVCLHNFLIMKENVKSSSDKQYSLLSLEMLNKNLNNQTFENTQIYSQSFNKKAEEIRQNFKEVLRQISAK